jgi:hypothetical protein
MALDKQRWGILARAFQSAARYSAGGFLIYNVSMAVCR